MVKLTGRRVFDDGNAPRPAADRDFLPDLTRGHIDDRDIVRRSVGGEHRLAVRRDPDSPRTHSDFYGTVDAVRGSSTINTIFNRPVET